MRANLAVFVAVFLGLGAVAAVGALGGCTGDDDCGCMKTSTHQMDCCAAPQSPQGVAGPTTAPGKIVNARCPMMGGAINAVNVPASLTREYKGQTVAFCCGGCPAKWDGLSDAEKDARLAKVMVK